MLLFLAAQAHALEPVLDVAIAGSYFPEGVRLSVTPGLKQPLWNRPDNVLFKDTWLRARLIADVTPSYARVGPEIGFSPVAVFELTGHYVVSPYFGTFSSIKGLPSADTVATDDLLDSLDARTGLVTRYGGEATLQAQVGPVVMAAWGGPQVWHTAPAEDVGEYYYEPETELVLAMDDTTWQFNGVALYQHTIDDAIGRKLLVGSFTDYHMGVATGDTIFRTGLMGVFKPDDKWALLLLVLAQIEHRIEPTPFPPYLAVQARFTPNLGKK